jgi:hypothetical protein
MNIDFNFQKYALNLFRNQWGSSWGTDSDGNICNLEQESCGGYMYISRDIKNNCGISTDAYVPEVYNSNVPFIYN